MGKGSSSQTSTTSGPPAQFLQAYQDTYNRAQGVANQPLQQYPLGPNASNVVQPLTPYQNQGISQIAGVQGQQAPYLQSAEGYMRNAATPVAPLQFQGVEDLPQQGLAGFTNASNTAANLPGVVAPYLDTARAGDPSHFASNISTYYNPYQQNVIDTTRDLFNQQNAEQFNQIRGNAAAQGAFGGDREAIAESVAARQQQLAQDPVLAQLAAQGYTQAAQELGQQQQLGLAGGQLAQGASLAGGQLGLSAGQGLLGEFNTQQQTGVGAQEATDWLNQAAGYGLANLGKENQDLQLAQASALLQGGGLQQQYLQQVLNAPYEQFIQQQAYPFQTTGWLANIAEGLGGASGGRSTTTYPGPSTLGQIGGLGLAGVGLAGQLGAFGGGGGYNPATWTPSGGGPIDFGGGGDFFGADGGRVPRANGGRMEPLRHYAAGGGTGGYGGVGHYAGGGVPNLAASIVPGAEAGGLGAAPSSSGGGGLAKSFMQPVTNTTQTQSGGGGGILGALGSIAGLVTGQPWLGTVGGLASRLTGVERGGAVPRGTYADGGQAQNNGTPMRLITLAVPDLSKSYIPSTQAPARTMGPPAPPPVPQQGQGVGNPLSDALSTLKSTEGLSKLFKSDGDGSSLGGAVEPSPVPLQFDYGGMVPGMTMGTGGPSQQRAAQQQYTSLSAEKLQELAMRYPPTTPQGAAIARALQIRRQNPTGGYPGGPTPTGPFGPSGEATPGTTAARGGAMGLADGGLPMEELMGRDIPLPVVDSLVYRPSYAEGEVMPGLSRGAQGAFDNEFDATIDSRYGHLGRDEQMLQMMRAKNARPASYSIGLAEGGDVEDLPYIEPPPKGWRPPPPPAPKHYDVGGDVDEFGMEDYLPPRPFGVRTRDLNDPQGLGTRWRDPVFAADLPSDRVVARADIPPHRNDVSGVLEHDFGGLSLPPKDLVGPIAAPPPAPAGLAELGDWSQRPGSRLMESGRPALPPGTRFNSRGEPISEDLFRDLPGQKISAPLVGDHPNFGALSPTVEAQRAAIDREFGLGAPSPTMRESAAPPPLSNTAIAPQIRPQGAPVDTAAPRGGRLSWGAVADLARDVGFPEDKVPIITAIVGGESRFDPYAYNGRGENSYGLTQINADAHGPIAKEALGNPRRAMELAFDISKGGKDFSPWSVYKSGAYRAYLDPQGTPDRMAENRFAGLDKGIGVAPLASERAGLAAPMPQANAASPGGGLSPSIDKILKDIESRQERGASIYSSPYLPLIAAGLGMLASRSPFPGVALGEGGLQGLKMLENQQRDLPKNELERTKADMERLKLNLMPLQMQAGIDSAAAFTGNAPVAPISGGGASPMGAIPPTPQPVAAPTGSMAAAPGVTGQQPAAPAPGSAAATIASATAPAVAAVAAIPDLKSQGAAPAQIAQAATAAVASLPAPTAERNNPIFAEYDRQYAAIKQSIVRLAPFAPDKLPGMMEQYQKLLMSDPRNQALAERLKAEAKIGPEIITAGGKSQAELPAKKEFAEFETGQHIARGAAQTNFEPQEYEVALPGGAGSMTLVAPRSQVFAGTAPGIQQPLTFAATVPLGPPATMGGKFDPDPESLIAVAPPPGVTAKKIELSEAAKGKLQEDHKTLEHYRATAQETPLQLVRIDQLGKLIEQTHTGKIAEAGYGMAAWAKAAGLESLIPKGYDPSKIEEINKLATQLVFAQIKQIGGRVLVSEIEGLARANPNVALTPEANRAILENVALEQQLGKDRYSNASAVFSRYKQLGNFDAKYLENSPAGDLEKEIHRHLAPAVAVVTPASTLPAGYPANAQRAPNGKWYVPDPSGGWRSIIPGQANP